MNEQMQQLTEKTLRIIETLATKLGTTAEYLWGVLTQQALVSSVTEAIMFCVYAIAIAWAYRLLAKRTEGEKGCNSERTNMLWMTWIAVTAVLLVALTFEINGIVTGILNPEYWALKEIINRL